MKINANGTEIDVILSKSDNSDYISLTDLPNIKIQKTLDSLFRTG